MIDLQAIRDRERIELLENKIRRQEATAAFILSCAKMAMDLNQMCRARRHRFPYESLEEHADTIHKHICDEFRRKFGRPLFEEATRA